MHVTNYPSIILLIPYFGAFPEWAPLYFETLRKNSTIHFLFYTDCDTNGFEAPNISFKKIAFEDYLRFVNEKLSVPFSPANYYKLCDLRPFFGLVHYDDIKDFEFFGWTDMDILFGDIRSFYTNDVLSKFDVLSTHQIRISGHLALFRNTAKNRKMYKKIYDWKNKLQDPFFVGIDEHGITNAYTMTIFDKFNEKFHVNINNFITRKIKKWKVRKLYLKEQYTTPFTAIPWIDGSLHSNQPNEWYYRDGVITNNRDKNRSFMYLHLMNFKSSLWRHDGTKAPWEGKDKICYATVEDMKHGIVINQQGIYPQSFNS